MYAKVFKSMYEGTLRGHSDAQLVFVNMLANADAHGQVDRHFRAIGDETGLTVDEVRAAVTFLEAPDRESRTPEHEGRRIVRMDSHRDWGWNIVNYGRYRDIRSASDRREKNRQYQKDRRERLKPRNVSTDFIGAVSTCQQMSACQPKQTASASTSASDDVLRSKTSLFAGEPPPETAKQGKKKALNSQKTAEPAPKKISAWAIWIDLHRERKMPDPMAADPDTAASRNLAKYIADPVELKAVMAAYLDDSDAWVVKQGHALRHLQGKVAAYRNSAAIVPDGPGWTPEIAEFVYQYRSVYHDTYEVTASDATMIAKMSSGVARGHWQKACSRFITSAENYERTSRRQEDKPVSLFYKQRERWISEGKTNG